MSLMLDEIRQQPEALAGLLDRPAPALDRLRKRFAEQPPEFAIIAARGTSDNAALFGRYLFEIAAGIPTGLAAASVATLYGRLTLPSDALVIGISQSGESTDINRYLECAKAAGAMTVGIVNNESSSLASIADEVLPILAGEEASVAATKTYTSELMALYCLARALGARIMESDLRKLPGAVATQLEQDEAVRELADRFAAMSHAVVIARGLGYANGLEFALKLMETNYVLAVGFSGADFAHGPIAMVEKGFPIFAFTAPGPTLEQTRKLLERLEGRASETICIGPRSVTQEMACTGTLEVCQLAPDSPDCPQDLLWPIPSIIPAQMFAAHLAESKGLNPDRPRMLSKITRTL